MNTEDLRVARQLAWQQVREALGEAPVRAYFRELGRRGGQAGRGSPAKRAAARRAALIRWGRLCPWPRQTA